MAARLRDINPDIEITEYPVFYMPENADQIDLSGFDCIVDAIDTVTAKLHLIQTAKALGVPIISSMGTGNKLRPDLLMACDISKTTTCPLARVMRREPAGPRHRAPAGGVQHRTAQNAQKSHSRPRTGAAPSQGHPRQQPVGTQQRRAADRQ